MQRKHYFNIYFNRRTQDSKGNEHIFSFKWV